MWSTLKLVVVTWKDFANLQKKRGYEYFCKVLCFSMTELCWNPALCSNPASWMRLASNRRSVLQLKTARFLTHDSQFYFCSICFLWWWQRWKTISFSLLRCSFWFLTTPVPISMTSHKHTQMHTHTCLEINRLLHTLLSYRYAADDGPTKLTNHSLSHSGLIKVEADNRWWVIILQEVLALSCVEAKSSLCTDGRLLSTI